jgi:hypothetical protein
MDRKEIEELRKDIEGLEDQLHEKKEKLRNLIERKKRQAEKLAEELGVVLVPKEKLRAMRIRVSPKLVKMLEAIEKAGGTLNIEKAKDIFDTSPTRRIPQKRYLDAGILEIRNGNYILTDLGRSRLEDFRMAKLSTEES